LNQKPSTGAAVRDQSESLSAFAGTRPHRVASPIDLAVE
jgi:hypothetical protein